MSCQEDITVLAHQPSSALVMGHICTPSFWDPAHVKNVVFGRSTNLSRISEIRGSHLDLQNISQVEAVCALVWTLSSDDRLDHHPNHLRRPWINSDEIWYRLRDKLRFHFQAMERF